MKTIQMLFILLVIPFLTYGQLQVNGSLTPQQLVQNILVGGGVNVTNVQYTGPNGCIGSFTNGQTTNLGLASGILLSTGGIANVPNPGSYFLNNNMGGSGDPLLAQIGGGTSYDAVVLTFSFTPQSTPVQFRYVFGSEEYPEYVCSSFNDAFGFFVSGPNPQGGNYNNYNVARIPNTNIPVTINSVNPGQPGSYGSSSNCISLSYSQYYVNNLNGTTICFDGFTTVLTATIDVVPCQTYQIKIAISDIGDARYDSGVFLEANSFQSNAINASVYFTNPNLGQNAIEGCSNALVSFTLNQPATQPVVVNYTIGGTATNGVDYQTIPSSITIPAGSDSVGFFIQPILDGVPEGTEYVVLIVQVSTCATDTIIIPIVDNTPVQVSTSSDITICDGQQPVSFSATGTGGVAPLTYNWSGGLGTNPNVTISPPVGNHNYVVTVTDACGRTATDNISVTVLPTPTSDFTAVTPICAGTPSNIVYVGSGGSTFVWNFDGATILSGTPPGPGPYQITWNTAGTYTVTLQVQASNGCWSVPDTQYIMVLAAGTPNCCQFPTPFAGPDKSVCGLTTTFNADPPDNPSYVGIWTQISGPGTSTFGQQGYFASSVTVSQPGTYTYSWKEINGPCDSTDFVTITFIQIPTPNAGPDQNVCGVQTTLQGTSSTGGTITWTGTGVANPNNLNSNVVVPITGTYTYVLTENNQGCINRDTVIINFLAIPTPNAGVDTTACGNRVTLVADSTYPGFWSGPSGVIYLNGITSPTTPIIVPNYTGNSYQATFTWTQTNGPCSASDNVVITFIRPPHAEAGNNVISVCGTFATLAADTIGSGIIQGYWYSVPSGPIINQTGAIPWNATVDISNMGQSAFHHSVGEFYLYWVVNNGQCSNYDSVKVVFFEIPKAYAGEDTAVCGKSYNLSATWSINNPVGQWLTLSGPGTANFSHPTNRNTLVTVTQFGVYQFIWREMNAGRTSCYDEDTITIEFKVTPMPDAGLDQSVCGKFAYICATPSVPGGQWSGPTGVAFYDAPNGNIVPSNKDSACTWIRWPSENNTITMYWTEFNGVCYGYDSVNVYFGSIQEAIITTLPSDSLWCGPSYPNLSAVQPAYGYGYWIDAVQNTTFTPSPYENSNLVATIDTGGTTYYGPHYFYWITVNGNCRDTSDVHYVRFIQKPRANAGGNYWAGLFGPNSDIKTDTVCGLNYQMGAIPSIGVGTWYSLDPTNVYFVNGVGNHTTTHVYNDSLYLTCNGCYTVFSSGQKYREFIWQEYNDICFDSDTLRLYFAPRPTGQFTVTMPACRYDSSMIIAHTWNLPNHENYGIVHFAWTYPGGTLSPVISDPTISDTIYVSWSSGNSHTVTLITTNMWGCHSGIVTRIVNEPPKFSPTDSVYAATCGDCNGKIRLFTSYNNNPNYFTFEWLDTGSPTLVRDNLCPKQTYYVKVKGQSLSPDASPGTICVDTIGIWLPDTGHVYVNFDTLSIQQMQAAPYSVYLINYTINGRKYSWRIYDDKGNLVATSTQTNLEYTFTNPGCYRIVLIGTSKQGCRDTMEYAYVCVDAVPVLEIPNVFTPNGDGQNDEWLIHAKSIKEFKCTIYNRWGKKIYEWDDVTKGWNGKINGNGADASPGVYYYVITAKDKKDKEYEEKGYFYLLKEKK